MKGMREYEGMREYVADEMLYVWNHNHVTQCLYVENLAEAKVEGNKRKTGEGGGNQRKRVSHILKKGGDRKKKKE